MIRRTFAKAVIGMLAWSSSIAPTGAVWADESAALSNDEIVLTPAEMKAAAARSSFLGSSTAVLTAPTNAIPTSGLSARPALSLADRTAQAAHQLALDASYAGAQALRPSSTTAPTASTAGPGERMIGGESRAQVTNTTTTPYKGVCYVYTSWPNNTYSAGTAEFVGTRVVLSVAHMVHQTARGGWAKSIRVIPAKNGSSEPYGSQYAYTAYAPSAWTSGQQNPNYDMSWIILPDKTLYNRVGYAFGYAVPSDSSLKSTKLNLAGYPGDKPTGTMWFEYGGGNQVVYPSYFYHYLDTYGGSSGAPMWYYNGSSRYVWGVNCAESTGSTAYNVATRMTSTYVNNTNQLKSQFP